MPAISKVNGLDNGALSAGGVLHVRPDLTSMPEVQASAVVRLTESATPARPNPSLESIFGVAEARSPELNSAMRLLPESIRWLDFALQAIDDDEYIAADDAALHVQSLLPELFCCRRLGEGFGAIVNAAMSSFEGLDGSPLEKRQVMALRSALSLIREQPGISFECALHNISALERVGLTVEPAIMDDLGELLRE